MTFLDPSAYVRNTPDQVINQFDPFVNISRSHTRTHAICRIYIGSYEVDVRFEVTDAIFPHLISVHVDDSIDHHTCDIELDDRYGSLPIPPLYSPCIVELGWKGEYGNTVFNGDIQDIEHGCSRSQGGGRRMWIHAKGENFWSPGKENQQDSIGEGAPPGESEGQQIPLSAAIQKFADAASHSAIIHPAINDVTRDHWSIDNESYLNWSSQTSEELGLFFRVVKGTQSEWTIPGSRADQAFGIIQATWGDNLIGWRVHPAAARPAWNEVRQQYFDTRKGIWQGIMSAVGGMVPAAASMAGYSPAGPASSGGAAQQQADGTGDMVSLTPAPGRVVIIGEPSAAAGLYCNIVGARPGVDGVWYMHGVEHLYSRQGYITWLNVWYPSSKNAVVRDQLDKAGFSLPSYDDAAASFAKAYSVDPNQLANILPETISPDQMNALVAGGAPPEAFASTIVTEPPVPQPAPLQETLTPEEIQALVAGTPSSG